MSASPAIAIIGMGPRGISMLERLAAYTRALGADRVGHLIVHTIDDAQHGAGRIWDTEQTRTLCMNTLAGAVTLFTEPGSTVGAPVLEGPTMYEWIQLIRGEHIDGPKAELFAAHVPDPEIARSFATEIAATRPESNPSRALYGAYLQWVYEVALDNLPENIEVRPHHGRALRIDAAPQPSAGRPPSIDIITIAGEETGQESIEANATVLAGGWLKPAPTDHEAALADAVTRSHDAAQNSGTRPLVWVAPDNPLEQNVHDIPTDGSDVLVRGLGMGFYDVMALLTFDRGGEFEETPNTRSGLTYHPSGKEPHLIVASGRGYPYIPKSEYHSLPPRSPHVRLNAAIADLHRAPAGSNSIDFATQVLPAVARDAFEEYYRQQERLAPEALRAPLADVVAAIDAVDLTAAAASNNSAAVYDALTTATAELSSQPFEPSKIMNPLAGVTADSDPSVDELTAFIAEGLSADIAEAAAGHDSALKAGLWALSSARKKVSVLGSEARYTLESRRGAYSEFMTFGQMMGSGPPLFRTRQLLALVDAGLVTFLGARPTVSVDGTEFVMRSGEREARSTVLVDAWMHSPDIRRPGDTLSAALLAENRVRPFVDGGVATGSPEIDPATRRAVNPDGQVDESVHIVGIPTYAQMPDTTISPMPGTDPLFLQETDKAVRSLLIAAGALGTAGEVQD